jgi:hypothetical protein
MTQFLDNFWYYASVFIVFFTFCAATKLTFLSMVEQFGQSYRAAFIYAVIWVVVMVAAFVYLVTGGACGR